MNAPKFTRDLPNKEGFYWWTNFGEHTPTILWVEKDCDSGELWASNEEFQFKIEHVDLREAQRRCKEFDIDKVDGFYYGEELWCYIPCPTLPNGKVIKPDCY